MSFFLDSCPSSKESIMEWIIAVYAVVMLVHLRVLYLVRRDRKRAIERRKDVIRLLSKIPGIQIVRTGLEEDDVPSRR